jgi:hypothetical protein
MDPDQTSMDPDQTVRCAGWSGSMLVANPLRWFCRDAAHIYWIANATSKPAQ